MKDLYLFSLLTFIVSLLQLTFCATLWSSQSSVTSGGFKSATENEGMSARNSTSNYLSIRAVNETFTNPVYFQDLADLMIVNVNNTFYYSASTMHYSPGAPVLRSYDLVNWEYIGHSVPTLDFGDDGRYDLTTGRAYVAGIWASFFNYRPTDKTWIWGGCVDFARTHIFTAPDSAGPWTKKAVLGTCLYDSSILIDDDGATYIAYGSTTINVARLSDDFTSVSGTRAVFNSTLGSVEGSRFYKRNGRYYIFITRPSPVAEYVLMSQSVFGPYTMKTLVDNVQSPITSGSPHQGGMVTLTSGESYYMAFIDVYPAGRTPVLAPMTWGTDNFPSVVLVNGKWGSSYNYPLTPHPLTSQFGTDSFSGNSLKHEWEWNHDPNTSKFVVNNGLTLYPATVTSDLYSARNTLTRRIPGPASKGTVSINTSLLSDGARTGLALFRDSSAWIGIAKANGACSIRFVDTIVLSSTNGWVTNSTGTVRSERTGLDCAQTFFLRIVAYVAPSTNHTGAFLYSTDGNTFTQLGTFTMITDWRYFMGYRFGIFHYGTTSLDGNVKVNYFDVQSA